MRQRTIIFVVLAAFFGLGTIYFARTWLSSQRAEHVVVQAKPEAPGVAVMVAARDLPTGAFVRPEDLRWQAWPEGQVADNYLLKGKDTPESLSGAVVRQAITAGQPVTTNRVIKPGDRGFLAAVLSPGMRAVSAQVTPVSDVAGLVFPGDHVDVILAHRLELVSAKKTTSAFASETVLTNLRVLAVDQSTGDLEKKPKLAHTVTFEATPKQAEALEVASTLGNLYLSLRGLPGTDPNNQSGVIGDDGLPVQHGVESVSHTWDTDVSPLINHDMEGKGQAVTILRGAVTGGGTTSTVTFETPKITVKRGGTAGAQTTSGP
jgi:pilus assembly protein CpaB